MIDWFNVGANALWLIALSLALATLSYASWQASLQCQPLREQLKHPGGVQASLNASGVLFCLGMAATSRRWWETGLWLALGLLLAGRFFWRTGDGSHP